MEPHRAMRSIAAILLKFESPDVDDPVYDPRVSGAALVPVGGVGVVAGVDGRAAGQEGVREGRAAVVLQGAEQRVDRDIGATDLVAVDAVSQAGHTGAVADQVV